MASMFLDFGISATLLLSAAGWLTQNIIIHRLSKDIETFRSSLREHEIRFSRMHEKRAEVIAELYSHLTDSVKFIDLLYPSWAPISYLHDGKDLIKMAQDKTYKLISYFDMNRIYFSEELVALIDIFAKDLREHVIRFELFKLDEKEKVNFDQAMKNVKDQIPQAMKLIEDEFRILLGVNQHSRLKDKVGHR